MKNINSRAKNELEGQYKSKRYNFIKSLSWLLFIVLHTFLLCSCTTKKQDTKKPNIIFILTDDMGYGVPGAYGGKNIATPNIDKLAEGGMRFIEAYAGNSVCAPSRASLLTGLHAGHTTLRGNTGGTSIKDEDITITEVLKNVGYTSGGFGKWGLGDVGTEGVPEKQGFERFFGYYHQIHAHYYYTDYLWDNSVKVPVLNSVGDSASYTHYRIMKEMKDFIVENQSRPFFCFGSWTLPHTDDLDSTQIPENDPAYLLYKDKDWDDQTKKYAAMNTLVDYGVGEIWKLVKDLGIEENTILIFASDNGGGSRFDPYFDVSGNLRGFKHQYYEGGIKIPFIAYWKGKIEPRSTSSVQTYFADVMPTLAELAGANNFMPETDGISLVPTLLNKGIQKKHEYLYWELPGYDWAKNVYPEDWLQQAIIKGKWKMLRHSKTDPWELYNLETDPLESNNLASQNPATVKDLIETIKQNRIESPEQIEPEMLEGKWYR